VCRRLLGLDCASVDIQLAALEDVDKRLAVRRVGRPPGSAVRHQGSGPGDVPSRLPNVIERSACGG
jgi:hypothetical protein